MPMMVAVPAMTMVVMSNLNNDLSLRSRNQRGEEQHGEKQ